MEIAATVSAFLTHVRVEKGLSSNTVSAYRRDLVKFDEFARKRKLSLEEVERLLSQPDVKTPLGLRDRAMLEVLYSTGLRVSELTGLRVSDLDGKVGCVRCIGKGDKERIVPVGKKALTIVERYLRDARPKLLGKVAGSPTLFVNRRGAPLSRVGVWKILSSYGRQEIG